MFTCERCGAGLPPNADQCAYCGTVSAAARAALQAEAARYQQASVQATAQAAIARHASLTAAEQAASRALLWGLLSPVFFCLPIPSVLASMAYARARNAARQGGLQLPTRAKVGLGFGVLSGLGFLVFWVCIGISVHDDDARVLARKAALSQTIARHANSPALDRELACALGELHLLSDGFDGSTNTGSFRDLDCAGAVRVVKDRAELDDFKLRSSSGGGLLSATICFKHGDHWFVDSAGHVSCEIDKH